MTGPKNSNAAAATAMSTALLAETIDRRAAGFVMVAPR
jgi:hypothetical protein